MDTRTGELHELRPGESMADLRERLEVTQAEFERHFIQVAGAPKAVEAAASHVRAGVKAKRRAANKRARATRKRNRG